MKSAYIDTLSCLPLDVALHIASFLQVLDLCSLSSCSRFWREVCGSDSIWESISRQRWPSIFYATDSSSSSSGWRKSYVRMHREIRAKASAVIQLVEQCSPSQSLEFGDFNRAIVELASMKPGLWDIQLFLFKPELSVLVHLVGLYYCIYCLNLPAELVIEALASCKISERQLCVKWWKLGRWQYGYRMRDESHYCTISLADLLKDEGKEVLKVIWRGPIHEVLRVQFVISNSPSTPWSCQISQSQC